MSREAKRRSPMISASADGSVVVSAMISSPAAEGAHDLDLVARRERPLLPGAGGNHDAVHGDGDAAASLDAARAQQLADGCRGKTLVATIDADRRAHAPSIAVAAKRSMAKGRITSSTSPLRMKRLTASAVTGVSSMPLR